MDAAPPPDPSIAPPPTRVARALVAVGLAGLAVAHAGLFLRVEPLWSWFYDVAWWSGILAVDGWVCLRTGRSRLTASPRGFLALAAWSAAFWLVFELANLVLRNWYYVGIPDTWLARGPGVFVSFATVLPGILEIDDLLRSFGAFERARSRPFRLRRGGRAALAALGALFLVLSLGWPRHFFPLIWGVLVLVAEPWLAARGRPSLLTALERGDPRPVLRALAAGLVAGLVWETWNFGARAKWIYTVPFFEEGKLFEMPYLGFLGFPPFALECWTFVYLLRALGWLPDERGRWGRGAGLALALSVAFSVGAIALVNRETVRGTVPLVHEVPGLPAATADALGERGVREVRELLAAEPAELPAPPPAQGTEAGSGWAPWLERAHLLTVRGLGGRGAAWLGSVGVATPAQLAAREPEELLALLRERGAGPHPPPLPAEVRVWVRGARRAAGPTAVQVR